MESFECPHCKERVPTINEVIHKARCARVTAKVKTEIIDVDEICAPIEGQHGDSSQHLSSVRNTSPSAPSVDDSTLPTCSRCTFQNPVGSTQCQICGFTISPSHILNAPSPSIGPSASSHPEGANDQELDAKWNCEQCTFANDNSSLACEICGHPSQRLASSPPVRDDHLSRGPSRTWSCTACTFVNPTGNATCEACQSTRPPDSSYRDVLVPPMGRIGSRMYGDRGDGEMDVDSSNNIFDALEWEARRGGRGRSGRSRGPVSYSSAARAASGSSSGSGSRSQMGNMMILGAVGGAGLAALSGRNVATGALAGAASGALGGLLLDSGRDLDDEDEGDVMTESERCSSSRVPRDRDVIDCTASEDGEDARGVAVDHFLSPIQQQQQRQQQQQEQQEQRRQQQQQQQQQRRPFVQRTRVHRAFDGPDGRMTTYSSSSSAFSSADQDPFFGVDDDTMMHDMFMSQLLMANQMRMFEMGGVGGGGGSRSMDGPLGFHMMQMMGRHPMGMGMGMGMGMEQPRQGLDPRALGALPSCKVTAADVSKASEGASAGASDGTGGGGNMCCGICLEDYREGDSVTSLPCLHRFHEACVTRWLQQATVCPACKHPVR